MPRREAALVYIDPSEWVRFKQTLDQDKFGKALARDLPKRVKEIGSRGIDKVTAKLEEPTPGGNSPGEGLAAIVASLKTQLSFARLAAGVRWTASASGLPVAHKGLLNVYNTKTFRNPVARTGRGNPYFGSVLFGVADSEMIAEMREALNTANRAIGARGL